MTSFTSLLNGDYLFDSHCHLNYSQDADIGQIMLDAKAAGVHAAISVAVRGNDAIADKDAGIEGVFYTCGYHPELAIKGGSNYLPDIKSKLSELLTELDKIVTEYDPIMIGECGLDFYWPRKQNFTKQEYDECVGIQRELFEGQIMLAIKHDLPLTVHSRDSLHECLQLLDKHPKAKVVMHSFTGDYGQLLEIRERGHLVGINGIITYSSAKDLRKGLTKYLKDSDIKTPKDLYSQGIVLETDSPFLLPRGSVQKKNQPANIQLIWNEILFLIK